MDINFTKKFMKNLRLSLKLNEFELAKELEITVAEYGAFEECPLAFGGTILDRYLTFLDSIKGADNLGNMFMEFARFDAKIDSGAVNIFANSPLTLVGGEVSSIKDKKA